MKQKALIVEDEVINTQVLVKMLSRYPDIEVIGEAKSRDEAKKILKTCIPDVIFLDVLLSDGSGFDILPYVDGNTHIIFTTGHGNYAVQAFEINAVDYLLKPFTHERLLMAIRKMNDRRRSRERTGNGKASPEFKMTSGQFLVKAGPEYRFVQYSDVLSVVSVGGNYTSVQYCGDKTHVVRKTLKEWEAALPAGQFIRVHRSVIVHASKIKNLVKSSGMYLVYVDGLEKPFQVARRHVPDVKKTMNASA